MGKEAIVPGVKEQWRVGKFVHGKCKGIFEIERNIETETRGVVIETDD
jgi:hypothetical protein